VTASVRQIAAALSRDQRLLGLDVGKKTIGLALSDRMRTVASPFETIKRSKLKADLARLEAIVAEHKIGGFVVGLPLNMDGSEGPRAQATRQFAKDLTEAIDIPLAFWDERLSTAAVTRTLIDADASRKRRKDLVDKLAAAYILQGALDSLGH